MLVYRLLIIYLTAIIQIGYVANALSDTSANLELQELLIQMGAKDQAIRMRWFQDASSSGVKPEEQEALSKEVA